MNSNKQTGTVPANQQDASDIAQFDGGGSVGEAPPACIIDAKHPADDPVIARFRATLKSVQNSELKRLYNRLPDLDERSRHAIWHFADCLVAKMLHPPLECLQDEPHSDASQNLLQALQRLFKLSE